MFRRPPLPSPFAPQGYLVGGAARDLLLGQAPKDYDWLVPDPQRSARETAGAGGAAFVLDAGRGYWRVVVGGVQHDFAPLPGDLTSELTRRDYTVNALALDAAGHVTDPTGGLKDLRRKTLRMVSANNLRDDPLRLLRGVRLATRLGFTLEADTRTAITALAAEGLSLPAAERIAAELNALLLLPDAARGLELLHRLGLLALYLPELAEGAGVSQGGFHHLDVLHHNLEALHQLLARRPDAPLSLRWAALLHDVAKPRCLSLDAAGRLHFYGHAEQGAALTLSILGRLRQSHELAGRAAALVKYHMLPLPQNEAEARRFVHRRRELLPDLLWLMLADREAARGRGSTQASRHAYALGFERILAALEGQPTAPKPLLSGGEIMALLNLPPGPQVGAAVRALAEAQALGEVGSVEGARAFVLGLSGRL